MRMLGVDSALAAFRWDLVYLLAQLTTDDRPGVTDLAPPVQTGLEELTATRDSFEEAQGAAVVSAAMVNKRDMGRDRIIMQMGGVARATQEMVYKQLFTRLNPTKTTRLGIDEETTEVRRLLGELNTLDERHPLRVAYETSLAQAQSALQVAKTHDNEAEVTLTLERSNVRRVKMNLDRLRLETHGKLLALLKDKAEADAFFRPTQSAPGQTKEAEGGELGE